MMRRSEFTVSPSNNDARSSFNQTIMNDTEDEYSEEYEYANKLNPRKSQDDWLKGLKFLNTSINDQSIRQSDLAIIDNIYSKN